MRKQRFCKMQKGTRKKAQKMSSFLSHFFKAKKLKKGKKCKQKMQNNAKRDILSHLFAFIAKRFGRTLPGRGERPRGRRRPRGPARRAGPPAGQNTGSQPLGSPQTCQTGENVGDYALNNYRKCALFKSHSAKAVSVAQIMVFI